MVNLAKEQAKTFGLKSFRERKKITQTELAAILEVSTSTVGMIETGKRLPSLELAMKIANYFEVKIEEMF